MKQQINPWLAVGIIVAAIVGCYIAMQTLGGSAAGKDGFYDETLDNPTLPPGVRPGETVPAPALQQ